MNNQLYISAIRFPADSVPAAIASQDFYRNHCLVYSAFPNKEAAIAARVLFRFDLEDEIGYLYVQSKAPPDWSRLTKANIKLDIIGPLPYEIPKGDRFQFRLLARPTYRIGKKDNPQKGERRYLIAETEQREWLDRKAKTHGFVVENCLLLNRIWYDSKNPETLPNGNLKPLHSVQFDGILSVTEREKFEEAVRNGIGTQKAYGFGLLSLAPI